MGGAKVGKEAPWGSGRGDRVLAWGRGCALHDTRAPTRLVLVLRCWLSSAFKSWDTNSGCVGGQASAGGWPCIYAEGDGRGVCWYGSHAAWIW